MDIQFQDPALAAFVADLVKSGEYANVAAVVESAIQRLHDERFGTIVDEEDLDPETLKAIRQADAEFETGQGQDFFEFIKELRAKLERQ